MTDKEKIVLEKYRAKHKKCYDCTWAKACSPTPMIDVWWECELTHKIVNHFRRRYLCQYYTWKKENITQKTTKQ